MDLTTRQQEVLEAMHDGQWRAAGILDEELVMFGCTEILYSLEKLGLVESRDVPAGNSTSAASYREWRVKAP